MTYNVLSGALNTTVLYLICLHLVASYFSVLEACIAIYGGDVFTVSSYS